MLKLSHHGRFNDDLSIPVFGKYHNLMHGAFLLLMSIDHCRIDLTDTMKIPRATIWSILLSKEWYCWKFIKSSIFILYLMLVNSVHYVITIPARPSAAFIAECISPLEILG